MRFSSLSQNRVPIDTVVIRDCNDIHARLGGRPDQIFSELFSGLASAIVSVAMVLIGNCD